MIIERNFLLFICSAVLNIVLTVCLIFTCSTPAPKTSSKKTPQEITVVRQKTLEDQFLEMYEEILKRPPEEIIEAAAAVTRTPGVSYTTSRPSSGLAGIRGRVHTGEINPVNFDNPDINILKQMGTEQYLIHFITGEQFQKTGDFDKAINEYTTAINLYPGFTEAFISRGNIWLKRNDYNRAIEDFSRAIRLDSGKAEIFNYRGFARSERGEYAQAIEDFSRAISINQNYVDALINRSHSYYQTGNFNRVIEDCTRILNLERNNAFIWNRRGSAYYRLEDDDKAISDFTEAIKLRANYAIAWRNRGYAWQSKGEHEKASADFAMAQQLGLR
ncbi:MAG: tetratricopeptide repeat protein [Treponema sp.]|nr:tetratricopeptide repeat protein [Treponema sp.]